MLYNFVWIVDKGRLYKYDTNINKFVVTQFTFTVNVTPVPLPLCALIDSRWFAPILSCGKSERGIS